jgi:hypothetical protein
MGTKIDLGYDVHNGRQGYGGNYRPGIILKKFAAMGLDIRKVGKNSWDVYRPDGKTYIGCVLSNDERNYTYSYSTSENATEFKIED